MNKPYEGDLEHEGHASMLGVFVAGALYVTLRPIGLQDMVIIASSGAAIFLVGKWLPRYVAIRSTYLSFLLFFGAGFALEGTDELLWLRRPIVFILASYTFAVFLAWLLFLWRRGGRRFDETTDVGE